jgi:Flp pilus assembly protein TadD
MEMRKLLMGIVLLLVAGPTWAQSRDENLAACAGPDPDARIIACTALLQSGQESALLSSIYTDRGIAYGMKGSYGQAIADLNQAIVLVPTNAFAYNDRATVYLRAGRRDLAIADYRQALNLDPSLQMARDSLASLGVAP